MVSSGYDVDMNSIAIKKLAKQPRSDMLCRPMIALTDFDASNASTSLAFQIRYEFSNKLYNHRPDQIPRGVPYLLLPLRRPSTPSVSLVPRIT